MGLRIRNIIISPCYRKKMTVGWGKDWKCIGLIGIHADVFFSISIIPFPTKFILECYRLTYNHSYYLHHVSSNVQLSDLLSNAPSRSFPGVTPIHGKPPYLPPRLARSSHPQSAPHTPYQPRRARRESSWVNLEWGWADVPSPAAARNPADHGSPGGTALLGRSAAVKGQQPPNRTIILP